MLPPTAGLPVMGAMSARERAMRAGRDGARMLPLVGAPILPMPLHVRRAAAEALNRPDPRDSRGLPELRTAIADDLARVHDLDVDPERRLIVTHGAMQGLSLVFRTVLAPGDEVVVPTPTFFFDGLLRESGARPVHVPTLASDGWALDVARLEAAITTRTRALLICNPNNPTGHLPDAATLEAVVALAARHGLLIISDDSWQHFTYDGREYTPLESFADRWPHIITVMSLSKYYALASWRVGYVIAPPEVVDALECRLQWEAVCCGIVSQSAATATLTGPRDWLESARATYQVKRDYVCDGIAASGLSVPERPEAGAFLLVDCARLGETAEAIDAALLRNGISSIRGADLHAPGNYVRLVFGSDEDVLADVVRGITRAVQEA
ncbi:pyridoxal phosphate-dependent aminotransferase [Nocardioides marmoriginsengisoli]|uniref:pyridoxal phosphate-dependent aminotransferase n=1 Tax=Nocardioides marmoriginsengisoli TaxID=661483 RepID=UPI001C835FF8|nr:pyridoxal phosphate-dependent aminotransferase [Nocardioides marmoriginsengisoli]